MQTFITKSVRRTYCLTLGVTSQTVAVVNVVRIFRLR